jgi:hypothetical protein
MRRSMRRFTRLTNGFSKKIENHACAVALHAMFYNFVRIHQTLKISPAMAAGVTDRLWEMTDLVEWSKRLKPAPTEAALPSLAQFSVKPAVCFRDLHGVGLAAVNAAQHASALCQHQMHGLSTLRADRRRGLELGHDASPGQAGALPTLSHR